MRVKAVVTTKYQQLQVRTGPSMSFDVVDARDIGSEVIFDDSSTVGGWTWLHIENSGGLWMCQQREGVDYPYLKITQNLDSPPPSPPPPPPPVPAPQPEPVKPAEPAIDYNKIQQLLDAGIDLSKYNISLNGLAFNSRGIYNIEELEFIENNEIFPPCIGKEANGMNIYNYFMDYSFLDNNLAAVRRNLNIWTEQDASGLYLNLHEKFSRFKLAYPDEELTKTFSYVIFTRPDLNILNYTGHGNFKLNDQTANDSLFYYLFKNDPALLLSLTKDFSSDHDFNPFLSNKAESFEISDEYIKTTEHGETFTGYKIQYGKSNIDSRTSGQFAVKYTENGAFSVYKIHKAWCDYISRVYRGEFISKSEYIQKKVLDYACSAYYFLLGPDQETILFWSKYYGVFPMNTPSSMTSWSKGNMVKMPECSINYCYAFKEDFSPLILAEFNMNSKAHYLYRKSYEPSILSTGKDFVNAPFVETNKENGSGAYVFKLRFRN